MSTEGRQAGSRTAPKGQAMIRRLFLFPSLAALLFAFPAGASAQTNYTIKLKEVGKGESVQVERAFSETGETQIESAKGAQKQVDKKLQNFSFKETVLEKTGQDRPTALRRVYDKAEITANDKTQKLSLQGQTIVIEKKDGKYRFQIPQGNDSAESAKVLSEEFSRDESLDLRRLFLPRRPVAVKDPWTLELTPLIKELSRSWLVDADKVAGTGKLVEVRKDQAGRLFGKMEFHIELPLKERVTAGGEKVPLQPGAKINVDMTLDACIDGSLESGVLKSEQNLSATALIRSKDGARIKMVLDSKALRQETRKEVATK
jgi:hypothetical protein